MGLKNGDRGGAVSNRTLHLARGILANVAVGKEPLMDFANGEILFERLRLIASAFSPGSADRRPASRDKRLQELLRRRLAGASIQDFAVGEIYQWFPPSVFARAGHKKAATEVAA